MIATVAHWRTGRVLQLQLGRRLAIGIITSTRDLWPRWWFCGTWPHPQPTFQIRLAWFFLAILFGTPEHRGLVKRGAAPSSSSVRTGSTARDASGNAGRAASNFQ